MRPFAAAIAVLCVTGCATVALQEFDQRYGKPDPTRYDVAAKPEAGMSYRRDVQPIVERRCVVCHACYDGPCQLKLTAWEGIARGTSKTPVYDAARLREAPTTRLFLDAQLPSQWWERGFSPVLNNRTATPETNLAASVLYRSLQLKREHPLPTTPVLSKPFDFSLGREATCPRIEEYESLATQAAARRNALRSAWARRARIRDDPALDCGRRALRRRSTAVTRGAGADSHVGDLSQRRIEQGAADEPLPVRAPLPGNAVLRKRHPASAASPDPLGSRSGQADGADRNTSGL